MHKLIRFALFGFICLLAFQCSEDDNNNESSSMPIIGNWRFISQGELRTDGTLIEIEVIGCEALDTWNFKENMTVTFKANSSDLNGGCIEMTQNGNWQLNTESNLFIDFMSPVQTNLIFDRVLFLSSNSVMEWRRFDNNGPKVEYSYLRYIRFTD